jgi:hypothetical protein
MKAAEPAKPAKPSVKVTVSVNDDGETEMLATPKAQKSTADSRARS